MKCRQSIWLVRPCNGFCVSQNPIEFGFARHFCCAASSLLHFPHFMFRKREIQFEVSLEGWIFLIFSSFFGWERPVKINLIFNWKSVSNNFFHSRKILSIVDLYSNEANYKICWDQIEHLIQKAVESVTRVWIFSSKTTFLSLKIWLYFAIALKML